MENPPYLFVASPVWLSQSLKSVEAIFALGTKFYLVSTNVQIAHLKNELFKHYLIDMEILDEDPSEDEVTYIRTQNPDFYKAYLFFRKGLKQTVREMITLNPENMESKVSSRIEEKLPPLFNGENKADITSWLGILASSVVPKGSEIYVYASGEDFLYQKNIHPYLVHEWKYCKRGLIKAYDPAMFAHRLNTAKIAEDLGRLPVRDSSRTPEYLRARFSTVLDEVSRIISDPKPDLTAVSGLINEAREYVRRIEGKVSSDTFVAMKRLLNEKIHRCQHLFNAKK